MLQSPRLRYFAALRKILARCCVSRFPLLVQLSLALPITALPADRTSLRTIESTGSQHPVSHNTTYTKPLTINEFHVMRKCVGWQRYPRSRKTHARTHMDLFCKAV